jgi:hypothetical protein
MAAYFNSGGHEGVSRSPQRPRRNHKFNPKKLYYPREVYEDAIDDRIEELKRQNAWPAPTQQVLEIGSGDTATFATVESMADYVRDGVADFFVRECAEFIVRPVPGKQYLNEIKQLFYFVRDACTYRKDTYNLEMNKSCRRLLEGRQFDCDDAATLLLALCYSVGHGPGEFVLVAADSTRPEEHSHVYARVYHNGRWYPMDATMPTKDFGWEVPGPFRRDYVSVPVDDQEAKERQAAGLPW